MSEPDTTIKEYYDQFDDAKQKLEHYRDCGDCFICGVHEDIAKNYNMYKRLGELQQ